MFKTLFFLVTLATVMWAESLQVAVAANVSYAMDDLKKLFEAEYPGSKVEVTVGSSGKLTAQIMHGAPYEVFLSANMKYPEALYARGLSVTEPKVYAEGLLALISMKEQPFSEGISFLTSEKIKKIAIANPRTAPYGIAAEEVLKKSGIYTKIRSKLVFGESVGQTLSYTMTAADIGFVAMSSLYSPKLKHLEEGKHWVAVESRLYTPIRQGIILLKKGEGDSIAKAFYDFMLGAKARNILVQYGYRIP